MAYSEHNLTSLIRLRFVYFQTELLDAGVCTELKVVEVTEERILPEVGLRQVSFEKALEDMDVSH